MAGLRSGGPSARQASGAMMSADERAAYNDAAVRASGGPGMTIGLGNPRDRARAEGESAVARKRKYAKAGITPEMEKKLLADLSRVGGGDKYGPGFQQYRTTAALDAMAAGHGFDPRKWSLPADYEL